MYEARHTDIILHTNKPARTRNNINSIRRNFIYEDWIKEKKDEKKKKENSANAQESTHFRLSLDILAASEKKSSLSLYTRCISIANPYSSLSTMPPNVCTHYLCVSIVLLRLRGWETGAEQAGPGPGIGEGPNRFSAGPVRPWDVSFLVSSAARHGARLISIWVRRECVFGIRWVVYVSWC